MLARGLPLRKGAAAGLILAAAISCAQAQDRFITPNGAPAQGFVELCLSTSGGLPASGQGQVAVPCDTLGARIVKPAPNFVVFPAPYPANAVTTTAAATGTTGAVTATMAAVPTRLLYICGFDVSAIGGTAAVSPITVTGLQGGTFTYQLASSAGGVTLNHPFTPCVPASGLNTAIAVATTADGTATAVDVNIWGFAQ